MITSRIIRSGLMLAGLAAITACERPPVTDTQLGFRGVGLDQVHNPRTDMLLAAANKVPAAPPAADSGPPGAWQNVQVLTDISTGEFTRTMNVISEWIVPNNWVDPKNINRANKCAYCHNLANMASDEVYTKVVARRMLQMTRHINSQYTGHVQQTGVTCYTCHRGNPVPANIWYFTDRYQPLRAYLDRDDFRVQSATVLPTNANRSSIKQTEYAYALMQNMSTSLGVNCGYCHNSRQWSDWDQSSPKRIVALRGIRMTRDLNTNYLVPLQSTWPANRLGPHGDGAKLQCATCHNGVYKPLYGAAMAKDYPALYPNGGKAVVDVTVLDENVQLKEGGVTVDEQVEVIDVQVVPGMPGAAPAPAGGDVGAMGVGGKAGKQAAPAPSSVPARDPGAGAMGGRGQSGKEGAQP